MRLALAMLPLLVGCAINPEPWTPTQLGLASTAVACSLADLGMSLAIDHDELNPATRNNAALIGIKAAALPFLYLVGEATRRRSLVWGSASAVNCAVVGWNIATVSGRDD